MRASLRHIGWPLPLAVLVYLCLAFSGIRYGLPDEGHMLSYNCDETTWVEGLSRMTPARKFSPYPAMVAPFFYLVPYGGAVFVAAQLGFVPLDRPKEWFLDNPRVFARFYLAGRYLQVFLGVLLLILTWIVCRRIGSPPIADSAVLLLAVTPSLIAASHFNQANVLVALLALLSLAFAVVALEKPERAMMWVAGAYFFGGIAVGTKFSALPLLVPLLYACWRSNHVVRSVLAGGAGFVAGFVVSSPFAVLAPGVFWPMLLQYMRNQSPELQVGLGMFNPLVYAFYTAMGPVTLLVSALGLALSFFMLKNPSHVLLLLWTMVFLASMLRVGWLAASGRILILMPAVLIIVSAMLEIFHQRMGRPWFKPVVLGMMLFSEIVCAIAIIRLHMKEPIQKTASRWIEENIPKSSVIGIPRDIFWWTPDTVYRSAHHPERLASPYNVKVLDFSTAPGPLDVPDYVVASDVEVGACELAPGLDKARCDQFRAWLKDPAHFSIVAAFDREVEAFGWQWWRPEIPMHQDDDLWATKITVYQRTK